MVGLGEALRSAISKFMGAPVADKQAIEELVRGIQRALLLSDVNVELVKKISDSVRKRAEEVKPPPGISRKDQIIKIVYEELIELLGGTAKKLEIRKKPYVLMVVGIQGSGKTTTIAKIAHYLLRNGYRPGIVCADTYRPAAYDQLVQLVGRVGIPVYGELKNVDAVTIALRGVEEMKNKGCDVIIIDTAGRHRDQESLMREMAELQEKIRPDEVALVIDGTIGQQAKAQAESFNKTAKIGWIILTKMDTSARGGGALSAVAATGAPIYFIGTGEKLGDIEPFDPKRYISRILGIPDIEGLIERVRMAEVSVTEEDAEKILSGKFTLMDMVKQIKELRKTGPLGKLVKMLPLPGLGSLPEEELNKMEEQAKRWEAAVYSMTPEERDDPGIIDSSRARRIARGAGITEKDVKQLVKQFQEARKIMKSIKRAQHRVPKELFMKKG